MSTDLLALDARDGWLTRRDPRLRIVIALVFALTVASLRQVPLIVIALLLALGLVVAAGLAPRLILRRLLALEGVMLVLVLFLPFSVPGAAFLQLGSHSVSLEGVLLALAILMKANAVVLALLGLVGSLEPVAMGHALARLRLPDKLVHLLLFTVRYLGVLNDEYRRLRRAMRTRGFKARSDLHTWRSLGWLMGMLLVRSLERAQRVAAAMKCRGFNGRFYLIDGRPWQPVDSLFAVCALLLLGVLKLLDLAS